MSSHSTTESGAINLNSVGGGGGGGGVSSCTSSSTYKRVAAERKKLEIALPIGIAVDPQSLRDQIRKPKENDSNLYVYSHKLKLNPGQTLSLSLSLFSFLFSRRFSSALCDLPETSKNFEQNFWKIFSSFGYSRREYLTLEVLLLF